MMSCPAILLADITAEQIIAIMTPVAVAIAAIINYLAARDAAKKVVQVKNDLANGHAQTATALNQIKATGEITHELVNSRMDRMENVLTSTLKELAEVKRRLAEITKNPVDVAAAELAEANVVQQLKPSTKEMNAS